MSQNINELIKRVENEEKLFIVAAPYGVLSNTVSDWHQNKRKLQKFFTENASNAADRKSMKIAQTPEINEAVFIHFEEEDHLHLDKSLKKKPKFV